VSDGDIALTGIKNEFVRTNMNDKLASEIHRFYCTIY
jgi:hypothetical protein